MPYDSGPVGTGKDLEDRLHKSDRAFIIVSADLGVDWTAEARRAVGEFGIVPYSYTGLTKAHEGSNVEREAMDDLYRCGLAVVVLSATETIDESWILEKIPDYVATGATVLAYAQNVPLQALEALRTSAAALQNVASVDEFRDALHHDIDVFKSQD